MLTFGVIDKMNQQKSRRTISKIDESRISNKL